MMAANFNENMCTKNLCIADLNVMLTYGGERLNKQIDDYISDQTDAVDIVVSVDRAKLEKTHSQNKHLSLASCEYILTGSAFYTRLIDYGGFMLHSSAVVYEGRAYLFSASCGTGKSTHTSLWCKRFGEDAFILNDDKPAIRMIDGRFYAYGTPWSGKSDKQANMCVPIAAVAFIERSDTNSIQKLDTKTALADILAQTVIPKNEKRADKLFNILDRFINSVNIYALSCNMEQEAVDVAYEAMSRMV